jgi:hypothetical protein
MTCNLRLFARISVIGTPANGATPTCNNSDQQQQQQQQQHLYL